MITEWQTERGIRNGSEMVLLAVTAEGNPFP